MHVYLDATLLNHACTLRRNLVQPSSVPHAVLEVPTVNALHQDLLMASGTNSGTRTRCVVHLSSQQDGGINGRVSSVVQERSQIKLPPDSRLTQLMASHPTSSRP